MEGKLAFCSKCDHYETYGKIRSGMVGRTTGHQSIREIPKPEFCAKCGAKMLYACPNCGADRRSMDDKCCVKCGKPYK